MYQSLGNDSEESRTLADDREDPATTALRNLDWEVLAERHTSRGMAVARALVQGYQLKEIAQAHGVTPSTFNTARNTLAQRISDEWRPDVLAESGRPQAWMPTWMRSSNCGLPLRDESGVKRRFSNCNGLAVSFPRSLVSHLCFWRANLPKSESVNVRHRLRVEGLSLKVAFKEAKRSAAPQR